MIKEYFADSIESLKKDFFSACEKNDLSTIRQLICHHVYGCWLNNIDVKNQGLILACQYNSVKTVEFLITNCNASLRHENYLPFKTACEYGNIEILIWAIEETLVFSIEDMQKSIEEGLGMAAYRGQLETVHYLFGFVKEKESQSWLQSVVNETFKMAAIGGSLMVIEYLFKNQYNIKPNIRYDNDIVFKKVCFYGRLNVLKYLFEIDFLNIEKISLFKNDDLIINACDSNNKELVEYLLASPKLPANSNVYAQNSRPLVFMAENDMFDLLKYFIIEKNIKKTEDFEMFLKQNDHIEILSLFEKREVFKSLQSISSVKESNAEIIKV